MAGEGPSRPTEYFREANVAEAVIMDIAEWIHQVKWLDIGIKLDEDHEQ